MTDVYELEREEETYASDRDTTGWRNFWAVRWTRTKVITPLMVILRR